MKTLTVTIDHKWKFAAEPHVFQDFQDNEKIITQPRLALLPRQYSADDPNANNQRDWTRFTAYVKSLNLTAPPNVHYKVLYLTRHGIGYHNQKHLEVGTVDWERNWSLKDGDGINTWFDSFLTPQGEQQAQDLSTFWTSLLNVDNAPLPQTIYTSPLARCLQTTNLVFRPVMPSPFRAIIKEGLRERWTLHTCNKRRTKSWIESNWAEKGFELEDGFVEEDVLGNTTTAETDEEHVERKHIVLENIWETDRGEFLELTCHSIAIRAIQAACDAPIYRVREGSSHAILVRGERLDGTRCSYR